MIEKNIIFMGTPEISTIYLDLLINEKYNIVGVFSQPPRKKGRGMFMEESPVQKLSKSKKINVYTPSTLESSQVRNDIKKLNPDIIIVMGYGLKIPNNILEIPTYGCFNIHVSLLPRWRGAAPIEHALLSGDKITGVSIFEINESMDAGPIISKESIKIDNSVNKEELTNQLNFIGVELLKKTLPIIYEKKIIYEFQNKNEITYANKISTKMRKIDFNQNGKDVHNQIRAFSPYPSAWFFYKNQRIKIIKSNYIQGNWEKSTILNDQFHIGCYSGKICPEIIQKEGAKSMSINEFLKGFNFKVGDKIHD